MTDICRLCASLKILDQLIPLTDPDLRLKEKLVRCCALDLPANDELMPQSACRECVSSLNSSWNFAEKVSEAQEILKKAFIIELPKNGDSEQEPTNAFQIRRNSLHPNDQPSDFISELSLKDRSMIISLLAKGYSGVEIGQKLHLNSIVVDQWIGIHESQRTKVILKSEDGSQVLHETNDVSESISIEEENASNADDVTEDEANVIEIVEYIQQEQEPRNMF